MKITAQEEYGLRCLLRLARAERQEHSLTIPEVAAAEGLSAPYVAKLLSVLRQAELIESVRGRTGGYRLARNPAEITLGSVLLVLGEPLFDGAGYCERHAGSDSDGSCVHQGGCTLRALWQTLEHWMRHTLNQVTLADLLKSEAWVVDLLRSHLAEVVAEPQPLVSLTPILIGSGKSVVSGELVSGGVVSGELDRGSSHRSPLTTHQTTTHHRPNS